MTRKEKKARKKLHSTRQLMGIDQFTEYGLKVGKSELVFFLIQPDNLSVLSEEGIRGRVRALTELLHSTESVRMLAVDSRESFQRNKDWYNQRSAQEDLPAVQELLRQDAAHLDEIQATTASAREFALVYRREEKSTEDAGHLKQIEKRIRDCGFHVRMAEEQDMMRLLAVYYQQDVTTEQFDRFDGERSANG